MVQEYDDTSTYISLEEEAAVEKEEKSKEILLNESELLSGLLELGSEKDNPEYFHKIQIKRGGKVKLEFRVRPLTEDESHECWERATSYAPHKKYEPKKSLHTDNTLFRSHLIYAATVPEDRAKTWDKKDAQLALGAMQGVDMIDKVLRVGEKSRVVDIIEEISGVNGDAEENAKN